MLPKSSVSFTIPSIHDETPLKCRLYYPKRRTGPDTRSTLRATILAHPYATLGGCYDDPVVGIVGKSLLKAGHILMTFNFRGARGSAGRTSWSGKGELVDYVSVYGFMVLYLEMIRAARDDIFSLPSLTLAGYSYGSMITSHLPDLKVVLDEFEAQTPDTPATEIRKRAQELSDQFKALYEAEEQQIDSPERGRQSLQLPTSPIHSVALGGSDSLNTSRRVSRESSRASFDGVRRSVHKIRHKLDHRRSSGRPPPTEIAETAPKNCLPDIQISYLLISPLLPPVASFTTLFSKLYFMPKNGKKALPTADVDQLHLTHPTCVIYGDSDVFTSHKKLRRWTEECKQNSTSEFTAIEIGNTGHFWHEADSEQRLREAVFEWSRKLKQEP